MEKTKSIVAGIAIGLAVIMSGGAVALAGKALGWYDKGPKEPEPTLEALNFEETGYGTYAVSLKDYGATEVVVPSKYNGKPVTEVSGSDAMPIILYRLAQRDLKEESDPDTLKDGIDRAVSDFVSAGGADGVNIGEAGFAMSPALKKITLPSSLKKISAGGFFGCTALEELVMPAGVTMIKDFAFQWCYSLTGVEIPESVEELGNDVFYGNNSLVSAKLPSRLNQCGEGIFDQCRKLKEANVPQMEVIPKLMFGDCRALEKIDISEGIKTVSERAFYNCISVTELVLPKTLTKIGSYAFSGGKLKEIILPETLTEIGEYAFSSWENLEEIVLPKTLKKIGDKAFNNCTKLKTVYNLSELRLMSGLDNYGGVAKYATNIYTELPSERASGE